MFGIDSLVLINHEYDPFCLFRSSPRFTDDAFQFHSNRILNAAHIAEEFE